MLQVARLASRLLGESTDNVRAFLADQVEGGGFRDRQGERDLYYSVFGVDALAAVHHGIADESELAARPELADAPAFVETFGTGSGAGEGLDLVHLACLARVRSALGLLEASTLDGLATRLLDLRRDDGGWAMTPDAETSTSYGTFLAIGAMQDLGLPIGRPSAAVELLESLALDHGGYALDASTPVATTPTTAASIVALRQLGARAPDRAAEWLRGRFHRQGGFLAAVDAPMPDLLSTAVALHALSVLEAPVDDLREPLLDFVDTLWISSGGFYGHWADEEADVEYTFYGLLALGHLAVLGE